MEEPDYEHVLSIESEHRLLDKIEGPRALAKLEIYPSDKRA
jgi:hypothetical protein